MQAGRASILTFAVLPGIDLASRMLVVHQAGQSFWEGWITWLISILHC